MQIFEQYSNIKLNEISSSGSRVVPCGETHRTKLIGAFRSFVSAPKDGAVLQLPWFSQTLGPILAKCSIQC
jgi:hypothetical protein